MTDTDGQLLHSFAANRDEEAFRLLAKRHLGLVFHTALRRTGNRPLAEEISQNVLLALARKSAALAKDAERLPGWLHRATLYEASKAMRAESSYQRRKQQGLELSPAGDTPGPDDKVWQEALPHLDLALDKLPESDRRILLLHYFEEHPFPRIAERLGKNVAAVQKQSQRALEKLSRILRGRGIALSVTALGAGLATHTAKAVPEAFVHTASSFALAGSSSPLAFSFTAMIASKPKVVIPLALLLLATPLVLQQLAIARERDHIQSLHDSLAASSKTESSPLPRNHAGASNNTISGSIDLMVLAKEQADSIRIGGEAERRFDAKLDGLDTDTLADLIRKTGTAPLGKEKKNHLLGALLSTIAKTDPGRGVAAAVQGLPEGRSAGELIFDASIDTTLSEWAAKNPAAAIAWFRENKDLPKLNVHPQTSTDGSVSSTASEELEGHLLYGLIRSSSPEAASYLNGMPETGRLELLEETMSTLWLENMRYGLPNDWLPPFLPIVRESLPPSEQEQMLAKLAGGTDWKNLRQVLAGAGATPAETVILARSVAEKEFDSVLTDRWQYDKKSEMPLDPGVLECLEELLPGRGEQILGEAREAAGQRASQQATEALARVRAGAILSDDLTFWALTKSRDLSAHIPEALELTSRIKDPALRQKAVDFLKAKAELYSNP